MTSASGSTPNASFSDCETAGTVDGVEGVWYAGQNSQHDQVF